MPTRLLLEGPDIDELLVRIHQEHGPGARIVQADKVRSGGVGGFFSREHYAVAVDVDGPDERAAAPAAGPRPERVPVSLLDLADVVGAAEAAQAAQAALRAPQPSPLPADASADRAPLESTPLFAALSGQGDGFARVLEELGRPTPPPASPPPFVAATPPVLGRGVVSGPLARAYGLDAEESGVADGPGAGDVCAAEPPPVRPPAPSAARPARAGGLLGRLLGRGVPRAVADAVEVGAPDGLAAALARALTDLPPPAAPPRAPGAVLAVLGHGAAAYETARDIARRARLDPADVWLAAPSALGAAVPGERLVRGAEAARRLSGTLRGGDVPSVVAVDAPLGADGWAMDEVTDTLRALGADAVWVSVDATSKPGDVEHHLDRLGRVDALVVHGAAATLDPGTCLAIALGRGVPTALVDGRRGDAGAWARLLLEGVE